MGNKKINVTGKSYSGNPITDEVVPVSHQWILGKFPRKQYNNGTIVTSTVKSDGTNTQTFMDSLGNPSYELIINGSDSLARDYHAGRLFNAYKNFKPGTVGFERIAEDSKQYNVPLATPEEAAANLKEVKRQFNNLQQGGEIPSNDQQQQLFVAIITDMAKTLGVEPSQELAEAVLTAFENNDDSQGLLTLFTQTKNKFMNETGLFREGGKMSAFIEKFKCGGKSPKKKTSKKQEGGEVEDAAGYITTPVNDRRARREWRRNNDATRAEARARQNELTDNLMGMGGISRKQARNSAAAMMMDPQRFMGESNRSYDLGAGPAASVNVEAPQMGTPGSLEHNYDNFDFNTAFGRARRTGEDTFMWRGKEYTTELAQPQTPTPDIASQSAGGVYPEYYRNNLQNAGAEWEWGKRFRQRRAERQAARQGRM